MMLIAFNHCYSDDIAVMYVSTRRLKIRIEKITYMRKPTCITSGVMDLAGETGGGLWRKEADGVPGLMEDDDV